MPRLKIDTKSSLYEPIEIEIDGKTFQVRKINESVLKELSLLDEKVIAGEISAGYDRIRLLIGDHKSIAELSAAEVRDITNFITENIFSPKKPEKNLLGPEDKKLPL